MARNFHVEDNGILEGWEQALAKVEITEASRRAWELVNDTFFSRTQQYVHVITADLRRSGSSETKITGADSITAQTQYGGVFGSTGRRVDYARYEIERGGTHDFIGRAWRGMPKRFQKSANEAIMEELKAAGVFKDVRR